MIYFTLRNNANQSISYNIKGVPTTLSFLYNNVDESWYLNVAQNNKSIVNGIRICICLNWNLFEQIEHLDIGKLYCVNNTTSDTSDPTKSKLTNCVFGWDTGV